MRALRWTIGLLVLAAGLALAVFYPTRTVVLWHEECASPLGPCYDVLGPVHLVHRGIRLAIGLTSTIPLVSMVVLAVVRQGGHRRAYLGAVLVLVFTLTGTFLLPWFTRQAGGGEQCWSGWAVAGSRIGLATIGLILALAMYLHGAGLESRLRQQELSG